MDRVVVANIFAFIVIVVVVVVVVVVVIRVGDDGRTIGGVVELGSFFELVEESG